MAEHDEDLFGCVKPSTHAAELIKLRPRNEHDKFYETTRPARPATGLPVVSGLSRQLKLLCGCYHTLPVPPRSYRNRKSQRAARHSPRCDRTPSPPVCITLHSICAPAPAPARRNRLTAPSDSSSSMLLHRARPTTCAARSHSTCVGRAVQHHAVGLQLPNIKCCVPCTRWRVALRPHRRCPQPPRAAPMPHPPCHARMGLVTEGS